MNNQIIIIDSILDYDQYICNSRSQKNRESLGFVPNCMTRVTAENILTELGYEQSEKNKDIWHLSHAFNTNIIDSFVKIVPKKKDSLCIAIDDRNGSLIANEMWDYYPDPCLFKILTYQRIFQPYKITRNELEELKRLICHIYKINNDGDCIGKYFCPMYEEYSGCMRIPIDFKTEEQEIEFLDIMNINILKDAQRMNLIDERGLPTYIAPNFGPKRFRKKK